jgi:hypothetical protein
MKANLLSFVFINFYESRLFNGLRPIQIKKFLSCLSSRPGLWANVSMGPFSLPTPGTGGGLLAAFLIADHHSVDFCLVQE